MTAVVALARDRTPSQCVFAAQSSAAESSAAESWVAESWVAESIRGQFFSGWARTLSEQEPILAGRVET